MSFPSKPTPSLALDHDRAQIVGVFRDHRLLQRRSGLRHDEATLHDVLRLLDEVEIDVALFGYPVAAVAQLDGIRARRYGRIKDQENSRRLEIRAAKSQMLRS